MISLDFKDKQHLYQFIVGTAGVVLILLGCLYILAPFLTAILLASIFALSAWPAFEFLKQKLNHRTALAAFIITMLLATFFIMPLVIIGASSSDSFGQTFNSAQEWVQAGDFSQGSVLLRKVPVVGEDLAFYWDEFSSDKEQMKATLQEYAGPTSQWLLAIGATIGHGLLHISLAILIAYFFFRHGTHVAVRVRALTDKFAGEKGRHLLDVTKKTLIGVVYGILGTALAQGGLAAFGFWLAGVPAASLLGLLTVFLSFIPIGPPMIWIPAAYWLFSNGETGWAIFMVLWGVMIVSAIDNVLKPYFISLGSNLPFMLVLLGIGGGVLAFGFIGIFIGPTLLALAYSIIIELSSPRKVTTEPAVFK